MSFLRYYYDSQVQFYLMPYNKRRKTSMTTSISSENRRNQTSILIRVDKITFPPKPDGQTDRQIERQTDGRTLVFIE